MTDNRPDRRIIVNPCNKAAEERNLMAIRDALGDLYTNIENTNIEEVINNYGGDDIIRFVVTNNTGAPTSSTAQNIDTGTPVTVEDWTSRNVFGCGFIVGSQGYAVMKDGVDDEAWVIWIESYARWVIATLDGPFSSGTATATATTDYWGGPFNKIPPPGSFTVTDELGIGAHLNTSDTILCALDDKTGCRYVLVNCLPDTSTDVNSYVLQVNGTACEAIDPDGNCLYDATLLTASNGSGSACALTLSSAGAVWALDVRSCEPKSVLGNERYIGHKIAANWNNGGTSRPLYAIVSDREPRIVLVRWNKADSGDAFVESEGNCVYNGHILKLNQASTCDYTTVEPCWIATQVPDGCRIEEGAVGIGYVVADDKDIGGDTRKLVVAQPGYFICRAVFAEAESTGAFGPGSEVVTFDSVDELLAPPQVLPWDLDGDVPSEATNPFGLAGPPGCKIFLAWDRDDEKPIVVQAQHYELNVIKTLSPSPPCKLRYEGAKIATMVISETTSQFIDLADVICDCNCELDPPYEPPVEGGDCDCPTDGVNTVTMYYRFDLMHELVNAAGPEVRLNPVGPVAETAITLEYDAVGKIWNKDVFGDPRPGWYGNIYSGLVDIPGKMWSVEYDGGEPGYAIFACNDSGQTLLHLFDEDDNYLGNGAGRGVVVVPPGELDLGGCYKTSYCRFQYGVFIECMETESGNETFNCLIARIVPDDGEGGDPARPGKAENALIGDVVGMANVIRSDCREVTATFTQNFGRDEINDYHSFKGYAWPGSCPADVVRVIYARFEWNDV